MPSYLTFEEYVELQSKKQEQAYFNELSGISTGESSGSGRPDPIAQFDIQNSLIDRLFGGTEVDIRPQGNIDLTFGVDFQNVENPALLERQRRQGGFDFDMAIQTDVQGSIGEKLNLSFNYNTQATFDFENPMKIDYNADNFSEDEIIKKIEAGNVSLPLRGQLIQGNQSLFGVKTELQFGRLRVTGVASQQNSEQEEITIQGGSQLQEFEVEAQDYDENRHFFLSHYNRDVFEEALENMPQIRSLFRIEKIQVWITNDRREFENVREIVAVADLGEPDRRNMTNDNPLIQPPFSPRFLDIEGKRGLPDNTANPLYDLIVSNPRAKQVDKAVSELRLPPYSLQQTRDFEKVSARQLSPTEFTYHPELGFISVNINVNPDQVLGIAYQYSYKDSTYQVGQFADDVPVAGDSLSDQKVLYVKMLKSTVQRVDIPAWDLMMKNVYSIGAYQVNQEDFRLDVYYEEPAGGEKRFLPDTEIAGKPLLNVFNLDNLNTQGDPQPDGVFDFVPGLTINPQNGRIMFPVLEPFGTNLAEQISDPVDSARYVFQQLYDSTKIRAMEFAYLNRFVVRGSYKSSVSSEISLGAFNIPPGSVRVSAGGQVLIEGQDYEVDYNIGRVKILNDAILASGAPIRVRFEDNTLFGFQRKTLLGVRADYTINPNFTIGGTFLHLFERPFTPKVNIGDDPINNKIIGLDVNYSTEAPWLTRAVDAIPLIQTKEASSLAFNAEAAFLRPGHSRAINEELDDQEDEGGVVYIDDFEGSISALPLHTQPNQWVLASVPQNDAVNNNPDFPESNEENTVLSGVNRALLNWYRIDDAVRDPNTDAPYVKRIETTEVFQNFQNATGNFLLNTAQTFDLTYYPNSRGPYNFDPPEGTPYSAGLNVDDGTLNAPETRWGGIMRAINTNDFQASNVEFIEFWMLSPFLDPTGGDGAAVNPQDHEGELYINLGNISEDILRDSRKFFENGLPDPNEPGSENRIVETQWGRVPIVPQITTAFDADPARRDAQDVGLDGLTNEQERQFFSDYVQKIESQILNDSVRQEILEDPAFDDYVYYNDQNFDEDISTLPRYLRFNNTQGNTPSIQGNQSTAANNQVTSATQRPDMEDINNDLTLNETEAYFSYRIPIKYDGDKGIDMDSEFVTDRVISEDGKRIWYRFKVPLELPPDNPNFRRVGGIQDFRSIRFIRMYVKDFKAPTTLRFARLDLVRNQWRRYILPDGVTSLQGPNEEGDAVFDVNDVNIEENASKEPFNYILPPGITRERAIGVNQNAQQNEQALSLNVCNLKDGREKAIYKIVNLDMRLYKGLKMFVHGEPNQLSDPNLQDGDLSVFIRLGSDFSRNYYEYEIPLVLSQGDVPPNSPDYPRVVWPEANDFEVIFQLLKDLKIQRNNSGADPGALYPLDGFSDPSKPEAKVRIKGNPNLGDVKGVMIGIRNPVDDGAPHCAEVWVNEMRVFGLDEKGGAAALARLDMQLADFGNVSLSGSYSSIGFGALDQQLQQRSREEIMQFDISTNLELGKFFPKEWGIQLPFYAQMSEAISNPQFDPYDLDLTLQEKLESVPADIRDSVRTQAQDVTSIRSINFTNVRKVSKDGGPGDKPMPWDIENFSVTYAQTTTERRDPIIESDKVERRQGALDYSYQKPATYIEPVKLIIKKDIEFLRLLTDFNFNPVPNTFNFSTLMDRQLATTKYRFTGGDPQYTTFYNKRWTWDRTYNLNWDLTRSLKVNFNAINTAVIDEPDGLIDTDPEREIIMNNLRGFGRNKNYNHNLAVNYTVPTKLIPLMDFINIRATYNASYSWNAAALNTVELGNVIQNTQNRSLNGDIDFVKLYNKSDFLKQINRPKRPERPGGSRRGGSLNNNSRGQQAERDKDKKDKEPGAAARIAIRPLMLLRKARISYTETFGTVVPGYMPETEYLGLTDRFSSPGWDFVAGLQPNIRMEDYYTEDDWLYNNWQWISGDQLLNQQVTQNYSQNIDVRVTLEPFQDFLIDLEATRSTTLNHSEFFRRDTIFDPTGSDRFQEEFRHLIPRDVGSFTMSYFALNTLFSDMSLTEMFNAYEDTRLSVSEELCPDCPVHADPFQGDTLGYRFGYGRVQQNVLIPAFIAAYSGRTLEEVGASDNYLKNVLLNELPRVNWNVTYNGLSKLKIFKDVFTNFNIKHGYKSTLTVNSFETELLFSPDQPRRLNPETGDFYSRFEVPAVVITEALSPLIGVDMRMKNGVAFRMDFKRSRNLQMSFVDNGLNETRTDEYVVGFSYRLRNFQLPFMKKKKPRGDNDLSLNSGGRRNLGGGGPNGPRNNGDLDITFDFAWRDDVTYRHLLDQDVLEPTRGTRAITISPAAEYQLNKQLSLRFFFDYRRTEPKISQSFPITNTQAGVTVRFALN
jgi:cell surface protein SprA